MFILERCLLHYDETNCSFFTKYLRTNQVNFITPMGICEIIHVGYKFIPESRVMYMQVYIIEVR